MINPTPENPNPSSTTLMESSTHHPNRPNPIPAGPGRRKGTGGIRQWLVVSGSGRGSCYEEVGKHSIMNRTGLPARDLRVLDPLLSYPSTILGRERAIVVNLENIRAVVTATEVLIPNSKDPLVAPFLHDVQLRLATPAEAGPHQPLATQSGNRDAKAASKAASCWPSFPGHHGLGKQGTGNHQNQVTLANTSSGEIPEGSSGPSINKQKEAGTKVLPFEFRALEVCLESACRSLENETLTLEIEAYPALDELTSKLSTLNLERVRQLKSRLVAISGRVQKVRDELEHLLDDDADMAEMYLSEKLVRHPGGECLRRVDDHSELSDNRDDDVISEKESICGSLGDFKPNIEELEMLLEAYFVQIDGTLNKLSHLREYVDDTEDYINIMLDDKQNQLLQMGVMLSTATVVLTAGVVVVSIFGMNITISLFSASYIKFWQTTFGTIGGCVGVYILAIWLGKSSGLLQ